MAEMPEVTYARRLHVRWSQLEADKWGCNVGSPIHPLPEADRTLTLNTGRRYDRNPWDSEDYVFADSHERAHFFECSNLYETIHYNTFAKYGSLKLTEVEMFFLSSHMTKQSASEWVLVYMGIGDGHRFRWFRDTFFPNLSVIAFDPIDQFYPGNKEDVVKAADKWNADGTNFTFHVRCFDFDNDVGWIRQMSQGKQLLLISDIRGIALFDGRFDKVHDQDLQLRFVQCLSPVESLLKFTAPNLSQQFFDYAPGRLLKQVFTNFPSAETRLLIRGVPDHHIQYNAWELYEKMVFHNEHLRGQVYETSRPAACSKCLDCCFDCTVLWDTVSSYALRNGLEAHSILQIVLKHQVYNPLDWTSGEPIDEARLWWLVEEFLCYGRVSHAVAALEATREEDNNGTDWNFIAAKIASYQPFLCERLKTALPKPASRSELIQVLVSLTDPFTLIRTDMNMLMEYPALKKQRIEEREKEAAAAVVECSGG